MRAKRGNSRTFIVGDVHGCLDELEALLRKAEWTRGDGLAFVGDLVAKGPDSAGVVALARERRAACVMGNHDAHLLRYRRGQPLRRRHEEAARTLCEADWHYLEALPSWLELEALNALVVHAALLPGVPLQAQPREVLLEVRSFARDGATSKRVDGGRPWAARWPGPRLVLFGHDALRGLQRHRHALGLDTGCCYGKALTGVWLPGGELVSVPARRVWFLPESE